MTRRSSTDLTRRDRRLGVLVALVLAGLTTVAVLSTNGVPGVPSTTVRAVLPAGAPALRAGDEVRVAGRRTGLVLAVTRAADGRQRVRLRTDEPVGRDAELAVRLRSPAGGRYLALTRGAHERSPLPDGGTIAAANVRVTEDLPAVVEGLGRDALADLATSTRLLGAGVDARGVGLNRALDRVHLTLGRTTRLLDAANGTGALPGLVRDGGTVAAGLSGRRDGDAARALTSSADLATALADPASRLDATLRELPRTEDAVLRTGPVLDRTLSDLRTAAVRLRPGVRALRDTLPGVVALLQDGPVLRRETAALRAAARPALRALRPVLRRVGPSAVLLGQALPPVRELSAYLARYPREFEAGSVGYYIAALYKPQVGKAPGYPIAPAMTVLTCARGTNPNLAPGETFTDRLEQPCR